MEHAHYSFKLADNNLEGTYYEVGEDGEPTTEMIVRVLFDSPSEGSFQLAKVQVAPATKPEDWDEEDDGEERGRCQGGEGEAHEEIDGRHLELVRSRG